VRLEQERLQCEKEEEEEKQRQEQERLEQEQKEEEKRKLVHERSESERLQQEEAHLEGEREQRQSTSRKRPLPEDTPDKENAGPASVKSSPCKNDRTLGVKASPLTTSSVQNILLEEAPMARQDSMERVSKIRKANDGGGVCTFAEIEDSARKDHDVIRREKEEFRRTASASRERDLSAFGGLNNPKVANDMKQKLQALKEQHNALASQGEILQKQRPEVLMQLQRSAQKSKKLAQQLASSMWAPPQEPSVLESRENNSLHTSAELMMGSSPSVSLMIDAVPPASPRDFLVEQESELSSIFQLTEHDISVSLELDQPAAASPRRQLIYSPDKTTTPSPSPSPSPAASSQPARTETESAPRAAISRVSMLPVPKKMRQSMMPGVGRRRNEAPPLPQAAIKRASRKPISKRVHIKGLAGRASLKSPAKRTAQKKGASSNQIVSLKPGQKAPRDRTKSIHKEKCHAAVATKQSSRGNLNTSAASSSTTRGGIPRAKRRKNGTRPLPSPPQRPAPEAEPEVSVSVSMDVSSIHDASFQTLPTMLDEDRMDTSVMETQTQANSPPPKKSGGMLSKFLKAVTPHSVKKGLQPFTSMFDDE